MARTALENWPEDLLFGRMTWTVAHVPGYWNDDDPDDPVWIAAKDLAHGRVDLVGGGEWATVVDLTDVNSLNMTKHLMTCESLSERDLLGHVCKPKETTDGN